MPDYDQREADRRHRERRDRIQRIRNEFTEMLDDYYEAFPDSEVGERELEYRIEERLVRIQREIDRFVSDFRRRPNA